MNLDYLHKNKQKNYFLSVYLKAGVFRLLVVSTSKTIKQGFYHEVKFKAFTYHSVGIIHTIYSRNYYKWKMTHILQLLKI